MKSQKGGDRRDYEKWISSTLEDFFKAYYKSDRLKFYSFFDTDFQREVPLNVFIYHPDYRNIELGSLEEVLSIDLSEDKFRADVKISLKEKTGTVPINIKMKKEFGKWKIIARFFI